MRAILISIRPQWVEKILNGEKTIEIRKTKPNIKLPCKVYIYETKGKGVWVNCGKKREIIGGKVVAEFTLKNISYWQPYWTPEVMHICDISEKSCVSTEVLVQYCGDGIIYAWHIEDLKIYDKQKELSEFSVGKAKIDCGYGNYNIYNKILKRPPQSWCYVNDLEGDAV